MRLLERIRHLIDRARFRWRYQISQNPPRDHSGQPDEGCSGDGE